MASAQEAVVRLFMQTKPPSDPDLGLALQRYSTVLVHLAVLRQMPGRRLNSFLL
jgi:hypothetical protein